MIDDKVLNISSEVETTLDEEDAANYYMAREIVQEVVNFGVNQITLLKIIELLALEVENREHMLALIECAKQKPVLTNSSIIT
tara:strand:- start:398 stop:646 length:249 start_codon:yes stop_codon:yes gene_type:complete